MGTTAAVLPIGIIMQTLDVVILAGGINKIPLYQGYTPTYKALLPFAGKPAIQYTLEAVRELPEARRILIVGPEAEIRQALEGAGFPASYKYAPGGDSPMESVFNALAYLEKDAGKKSEESERSEILFTTADLPLVTTHSVRAFLDACAATTSQYPVNLFLSAVLRRSFTGPFLRSRKGHMFFRGGAVYHGNLALIDPRAFKAPGLARVLEKLYRNRKNPLASALAGGWRIALSYVFGAFLFRLLSMEQMAQIASRRLGVGIVPVTVDAPEIAIDVDEPGDYELVRRELEAESAPS